MIECFVRNGFSFYSDALGVKIGRNLLFAYAFVVLLEYIAHDFGFFLVDYNSFYEFSLFTRHGF